MACLENGLLICDKNVKPLTRKSTWTSFASPHATHFFFLTTNRTINKTAKMVMRIFMRMKSSLCFWKASSVQQRAGGPLSCWSCAVQTPRAQKICMVLLKEARRLLLDDREQLQQPPFSRLAPVLCLASCAPVPTSGLSSQPPWRGPGTRSCV